jgi:asparagine synthase (glutamine-hydrolysing)
MCGIAVAVGWDGASTAVQRLIAGILHRGDTTDPLVALDERTAMCTRRLRIVDPAHGVQPQFSFDGRFLVAFNGEIYNHGELRRELESSGICFRTECDTEVVANVIRLWGANGLKRLDGMFAFVAIDASTGEFLAARDPFGVKPLYLVRSGDSFLFCSEIRPLLEATEEQDVLFLPPGHFLTRNFCGRYYKPLGESGSGEISVERIDSLLEEAVRTRVPVDLPAALLFSGGIDSTLVAYYARRFSPKLPGYIAIAPGAVDYEYAARYADATGFDLREVPIEIPSPDTLSILETIVDVVETFEPAVIRPSLGTYLVSQRIHEDGFRVALCGEGADELFAGYEPLERAFGLADSAGDQVKAQCLGMMHRANLQRVDRCSMRFQLEIREPFLDQSIVAYSQRLGRESLFRNVGVSTVGKAPLRAIYDRHPQELPAFIRDRQKVLFHEGAGTDATASGWLDLFEDAISDTDFREGQRAFADFAVATKEELFFLRALSATMDPSRIPHLRSRLRLNMPLAA